MIFLCFRDSILGFILPSASLHQEHPATSYSFLTHYIPHMPDIKEKAVHIISRASISKSMDMVIMVSLIQKRNVLC